MSSPLPEPFTVNGRYEIAERPAGQGGRTLVFKAYDTVTKRFVALKALWPDERPDCFEVPWTVLSGLRHRNIVEILDTGVWAYQNEQRPYFVMPFLSGASLDRGSRPLPVERVVEMVSQACRGLQAAHEKGLVHGDINPGNLFLMEDETVKILDLGCAARRTDQGKRIALSRTGVA